MNESNTCKDVLLMTATINIGGTYKVKITNAQERLFQYICSLLSWIKYSGVSKIVFCENSGFKYDYSSIKELAKSENKLLDVIVFSGNDDSSIYGKGYGEGKILEYALQNSSVLQDRNINIYKVTGRNFISNFNDICRAHRDDDNVFKIPAWTTGHKTRRINVDELKKLPFNIKREYDYIKHTHRSRIFHDANNNASTLFFKCNLKYFRDNLLHIYKYVHDDMGFFLEHAYYYALKGKNIKQFMIEPVVIGKGGTHGVVYEGGDFKKDIQDFAESFINKAMEK